MEFCSFASGSSGNSYMIRTDSTVLVVDCGISARKIRTRLADRTIDSSDVNAILITHEHTDHTNGLRVFSKYATSAYVYASEGTWPALSEMVPENKRRSFESGDEFEIGNILVHTFSVYHDASDPVGYVFSSGGKRVGILTDTGKVDERIFEAISECDLLVMESNHDIFALKHGPYPDFLKARIAGDEGHLSNETAANLICRMAGSGKRRTFLLAHLSENNNSPKTALNTVVNQLENNSILIGDDIKVGVARRDETGMLIEV